MEALPRSRVPSRVPLDPAEEGKGREEAGSEEERAHPSGRSRQRDMCEIRLLRRKGTVLTQVDYPGSYLHPS